MEIGMDADTNDACDVLKVVAQEVAGCKNCVLQFSRKLAVPGEGPMNAEIMFIGEGPGFYENEAGRPFVGNAGKFLDELLAKAGVNRAQVFITNVVKCRPPANRDPQPEELQACNNYLDRQIAAINPKMIVTLGRFSMAKFLPNVKISGVHGQSFWLKDRDGENYRLVVPMYHPAAALHQPSLKTDVEKDFARLPDYLKVMAAGKGGAAQHSVHEKAQPLKQPDPPAKVSEVPRTPPVPQPAQQISLPLAAPTPEPSKPEKPESNDEKQDNDKPVQLSLF
jgi:uracil-DNA glycosylase